MIFQIVVQPGQVIRHDINLDYPDPTHDGLELLAVSFGVLLILYLWSKKW